MTSERAQALTNVVVVVLLVYLVLFRPEVSPIALSALIALASPSAAYALRRSGPPPA